MLKSVAAMGQTVGLVTTTRAHFQKVNKATHLLSQENNDNEGIIRGNNCVGNHYFDT